MDIIIMAVILLVYVFFLCRHEIRKRKQWCYKSWWREDKTWHRCGICGRWLSDSAGGAWQDYVCPCGDYEFHFECGGFKYRVGEKWIEFRDENKETMRLGFGLVKEAIDRGDSREE